MPRIHDDAHGGEATEVEEVIVQATRSRRRVQDEPIRVEVLNQEEIEEKLLMRPGNISMLLAETGGLRVQVTSPALGSANIRVHGMRGRYTQLLATGSRSTAARRRRSACCRSRRATWVRSR